MLKRNPEDVSEEVAQTLPPSRPYSLNPKPQTLNLTPRPQPLHHNPNLRALQSEIINQKLTTSSKNL